MNGEPTHICDQKLGQTALARLTMHTIGTFARSVSISSHAVFTARGRFAELSIARDVAYGSAPVQSMDVWRLKRTQHGPLVLFLHGGGFQQLDKGSHWGFAERFARMGAVVFNADYRLAPRHRYPKAADDAALAYEFALANAARFGADPSRVIVAGASAGANLALGLALTHARKPDAAVLFSGLLQVSDMSRLYRSRSVPLAIRARMASISVDYPTRDAWRVPEVADPRFDPLLHIERLPSLDGLPALFVSTGSTDEVLEDSLRLYARLAGSTVPHQLDLLPHAGHAFQGFLLSRRVRAMWQRCQSFLVAQGLAVQKELR